MGRTTPSLSLLLNADCDILQLDVTDIDFDFPPQLKIDCRWKIGTPATEMKMEKNTEKREKETEKEEMGGNDETFPKRAKIEPMAGVSSLDTEDDQIPFLPPHKIAFDKPEVVCIELLRKQDRIVEKIENSETHDD